MTDTISRKATIEYLMTNMGWCDEDGYQVDDADEKRKHIEDLINGVPDASGWISVKDRMPDKYEPFYAACKSLEDDRENWTIEGIYKGTIYGGPWGVPMVEMGKAEVYAWMPKEMPEPPKEEKDNE